MELYGWAAYFGFVGVCFLFGYYLVSNILFREFEMKNRMPMLIFAANFAFSNALLAMIFFEIFNIGSQE